MSFEQQREQAHKLIDRLPEAQLTGLDRFLESIIDPAAVRPRHCSD